MPEAAGTWLGLSTPNDPWVGLTGRYQELTTLDSYFTFAMPITT